MQGVDKIMTSVQRFGRLSDEFHSESDRGCAVLMLCVLEEALRDAITARVADPSLSIHRLAPKGGLDAAIDSAMLLGLLTTKQAGSFRSLIQVRNKFAHGVFEGLTFETPDIANLVRSAAPAVDYPGDFDGHLNNPSIRTRFLMLAGIVWLLLVMLEPNVKRIDAAVDPDPTKLPPGALSP